MSELRDQRSLDILYDQANAWEKIFSLCVQLGATQIGSPLEMVKSFIIMKHYEASQFDRLMVLISRISCGDMEKIVIVEDEP